MERGSLTHTAEASRSPIGAATLIGRNLSFRLAGQILSALINVLGMVVLGNYLGSSGYGNYTFYYALVPLIATLSDVGVGAIVTREIARNPDDGPRLLGDGLYIKAATSGVLLLIGGTLAWTTLAPLQAMLMTVVLAAALVDISQDASVWVFRAHERQDLESLLLIVSQVTWVGGILLCVALRASLVALLATAAAAFLLRLLVGAWLLSRLMYRPRFTPEWARIRRLVIQGLPFAFAMFGVVLYGRIGILMLQTLSSASQVALFNVGYMLSQPLGFISSALSLAAYPALSRYSQRGPDAIRSVLLRATKYQILIALPLTVGLLLLSDKLIPMLFHRAGFAQAAVALKVMSLALVFIFMNLMSRYLLTAMDRQGTYLWAVAAGLATNVALGFFLIPSRGFVGACISQIGGEFAIFGVCQASLSRYAGAGDLARIAWKPLVAASLMAAILYAFRTASPILLAPIGVSVYALGLLLLKGVAQDEWQILRQVYVSFGLPGARQLAQAVEKA